MAMKMTLAEAVANIRQKGLTSPATGEKDSVLVQMNPREARALPQLLHTPPVINPHTGLLSFPPAGGQSAHDHAAASGAGGNKSGGGNGGASNDSNNRDRLGADPSASSPSHYSGGPLAGGYNGTGHSLPGGQLTIGGPARNYGDPYGANSPTGQALATHGLDPQHVSSALQSQHDYVNASKAYAGRSFGQKVVDALVGMVPGFNTTKPNLNSPNTFVGGTYHNQVNPAGVVGAVLGAATGAPLASTIGENVLGGVYNAFGGQNYSMGGPGVDTQTGESTGTGWTGASHDFGFGGSSSQPGTGAKTSDHQDNGSLAGVLAGTSKPVGTNAGSAPDQSMGVPAVYAQPDYAYPAAPKINTYTGQPWPTVPGNVWIGGGIGSRGY